MRKLRDSLAYNARLMVTLTFLFRVNRNNFSRRTPGWATCCPSSGASATFIYRDRSALGYFLPALIFGVTRLHTSGRGWPAASLHPVDQTLGRQRPGRKVASGDADLAAVWDGTKQKVKDARLDSQVYFIQLPDPIPNDLLVSSRWIDPADANQLREAIRSMNRTGAGEINTGDYRWWDEFKKADAARLALANLRRIAAEHPAPVTVQWSPRRPARTRRNLHDYVEARSRRPAAGSEFSSMRRRVRSQGLTWTLSRFMMAPVDLKCHRGLRSTPQQFQISFTDLSDLTKRIGG